MSSIASDSLAHESSWFTTSYFMPQFMGIPSIFATFLSNPLLWDSAKLFFLGSIIETGRRMFRWFINRFRLRMSVSAEFDSENAAYEWVVYFLTNENVWHKTRDFLVEAKSSQRKWNVTPKGNDNEHINYLPTYESLHFFRWKGYWLEIRRAGNGMGYHDEDVMPGGGRNAERSLLHLTIYTLDMTVLFDFVEECRRRYAEYSKLRVTIYGSDSSGRFGHPGMPWNSVKIKHRRPLESLVLDEGVLDSLLTDTREFLNAQDWYIKAGIPHRRGYLLHGPPGTGKSASTTVYAVAGELGLEIYSLSLASTNIDDGFLSRAVSLLPPRAILLIEDIDCAFPSRDDDEDDDFLNMMRPMRGRMYDHFSSRNRSQVTLSGLLNVLDGVGSEEGKLFFATTNHIDRLDPAILRPGRIDRQIEYKLANRKQAHGLFHRFFPESLFEESSQIVDEQNFEEKHSKITELSDDFARLVPEHEFSTAELQGYLLNWKLDPVQAASGVDEWVEGQREAKRARESREKLLKEKADAARAKMQLQANEAMIAGVGNAIAYAPKPHRHRRRHRHRHQSVSVSSSSDEESRNVPRSPRSGGTSLSRRESVETLPQTEPGSSPKSLANGTSHSPPQSPLPV